MKEELITFKTAKLAKEKGFEQKHISEHYLEDGNLDTSNLAWVNGISFGSAPTQSLLQKFLREEHNIDIDITFSTITGSYKTTLWVKSDKVNGDYYVPKVRKGHIQTYNTFEEALEKGLQEGLTLI